MLSIIIPVYKNKNIVEYCLSNVIRWLPPDSEVIVVDDASDHETSEVISRHKEIKVITHEENMGNTIAYNTGAKHASGDILIFIDSDIILFDESLFRIQQAFQRQEFDVVGTLLLYPYDNTIQHAGVAFDKWILSHIYIGRKQNEISFQDFEERQAVTAAFFACRREIFNVVGGFDETYRDGLEDIDFCLKCKEIGTKIWFSPKIHAYHLESATRGAFKSIRRTYNYSIFFSKWSKKFENDLLIYFERDLIRKEVLKEIKRGEFTVINFCTTPNWCDLIEIIQRKNGRIGNVHNLSGFIPEFESIDLYRKLPIVFNKGSGSLLFIVDHFLQLKSNFTWFQQRQCTDIILDRHATAIKSSYWNNNI